MSDKRNRCHGTTCKRRGSGRCLQPVIMIDAKGQGWCWYHNPEKPHAFGEGYYQDAKKENK